MFDADGYGTVDYTEFCNTIFPAGINQHVSTVHSTQRSTR